MTDEREQTEKIVHALLDELLEVFDALRAELVEDLVDYEGRLKVLDLPDWLDLDREEVRSLYLSSNSDFIGPRQVALAAAEVEAFVSRWVGDEERAVVLEFDDALIEEYRADCADLENTFQDFETDVRSVGSQVVDRLGVWLEQILDDLQHVRDEDERALAGLISDGSVSQGASQQEEIASLWEDYREKAQTLTQSWDTLEALGFEGVDQAIRGFQELRDLVTDTDLALAQIYPSLAVDFEPLALPERPDAERETLELERDEVVASVDEDVEERRTVELDREIEKTIDASRPELFDATPPADSDTEDEIEQEADDSEVSDAHDDDESDNVDETASDETEETKYDAFRQVQIREPIPGGELGLIWGLPGVFLAVVVVAAIAHVAGSETANPFERFPWLWTACVVVGLVMVLGPIIRRWRVDDPGTGRPKVVRFRDQEESITIVRFADAVKIGPHVLQSSEKPPTLRRWEQITPPSIGWMFKRDRTTIYCVEKNVTRWEDSRCDRDDLPSTAWELDLDAFWTICDTLDISK